MFWSRRQHALVARDLELAADLAQGEVVHGVGIVVAVDLQPVGRAQLLPAHFIDEHAMAQRVHLPEQLRMLSRLGP